MSARDASPTGRRAPAPEVQGLHETAPIRVAREGNLGCCTAWSGQLQTDASGNESIAAAWLLTGDAAASDDWRSTTVGQDTFHRRSPAVVVGALATASSHLTKTRGSER